jgi:hypothetical protein
LHCFVSQAHHNGQVLALGQHRSLDPTAGRESDLRVDPVLPRVIATLKAIGHPATEPEAVMRRRLVPLPRLQDAGRGEYAFAAVTAKEKLLQRAPHWSEAQAERALRAAESDGAVDSWGDLSKLHEVSSAETMRRLAKEERAAGHEPW